MTSRDDMDEDYTAEEENKLINEVRAQVLEKDAFCFLNLLFWSLGVQDMVPILRFC